MLDDSGKTTGARGLESDLICEALEAIACQTNAAPAGAPERSHDAASDPVMQALGAVLLPAIQQPETVGRSFIHHLVQAIHAHLAHRRSAGQSLSASPRRGLTPWQERRAKEVLMQMVGSDLSMADVAAACKLSRSAFTRAFKESTGETPYRWLRCYRVRKAKEMLAGSRTIADIAQLCGFADQSHLTREFTGLLGLSPGAWRRLCRMERESAVEHDRRLPSP
jgi:AraC-like DNA-binding protein